MNGGHETAYAYAAGFFDGEGSIALFIEYCGPRCEGKRGHHSGRPHNKVLRVTVPNTYKPTLEWLVRIFDGGIYARKATLGKKQGYVWQVNSGNAVVFLEAILPYLQERQEHAKFVLAAWEQRADTEAFVKACEERKSRFGQGACNG